jgi:hypothetical protein
MIEAMKEISRATGAFVLGVDHFGKAAETGTRGTSAKESGVDVVLATLGERSISGVVTNFRLAVRKVRGGVVGREYAFTTKTADMEAVDSKGRTVSTLKIIWSAETIAAADGTKEKRDPWLKSMSSRLLRKVLMNLIPDCGKDMRPYPDGPTVRAIDKEVIRKEFYKEYPAEGDTPKQKAEAKKKAFKRAIEDAHKAILIVTREIDDIQYVWLVEGDKGDNVPFVPDVPPTAGRITRALRSPFLTQLGGSRGILRDPTEAEIIAHARFMALPQLDLAAVTDFQAVIAPGRPLRSVKGMNVRVGNYIAPQDGPDIVRELHDILATACRAVPALAQGKPR